jgi:NTE family protein
MSGGGARAAYQVGVLRAIAGLLPRGAANPFAIICGTSAGAINSHAGRLSGADEPLMLSIRIIMGAPYLLK